MDALFLIYNLLLLTCYSIPLAFSWFIFRKGTQRPLHLYISIFFLVYIINNLVIYLTESVSWFSTFYDNTFMSVPTVRTIIFAATFYCMVKINQLSLKKENATGLMAGLLMLVIFLLFVPMLPNSALKVWLYYTSCQVFTFILGLCGLYCVKHAPEGHYSEYITKNYRRILLWTVIFSVLIVLEDTVVIFNFDVYTDSLVKIFNRSFTEDFMSIYYAIVAIQYLTGLIQVKAAVSPDTALPAQEADSPNLYIEQPSPEPFPAVPATTNTADTYSKFYLFCRKYSLTTREQDIMRLLLENKNNTDISEELVISIGTAKTHIHNIFTKLEVKKRSQLIEKYNAFKNTEPESSGTKE